MNFYWITDHPWGPSVRSSVFFYGLILGYRYSVFLDRVMYSSVTQDILLNFRMTNSPSFSVVGILMVNPSGLLFHILCISMFSLGILSPSVMVRIISWSMDVFSRDCSTQRLKISGNSSCSSVQIARRNFSPLIQMNHHFTDVRWTNHVWMVLQHRRWCTSVYFGEFLTRVLDLSQRLSWQIVFRGESVFWYPQSM